MKAAHSPYRPVLVGLGPYAFNTHLGFFRELGCPPRLVVELESARSRSFVLLGGFGFGDCPIVTVPDAERDRSVLSEETRSRLDAALANADPTHVFLCCEPKAHRAYLEYFIPRGVRIFCEKPLTTVPNFSVDPEAAREVWTDWRQLQALARRYPTTRIFINTQRRFCPFYRKAREILAEVGAEFGLSVTRLEISSCDGTWNLPREIGTREGHPYRHGYGKLMHSGYHFVDLLAQLLGSTPGGLAALDGAVDIRTDAVRPADCDAMLTPEFYRRVFPGLAPEALELAPGHYGELDVSAALRFHDRGRTRTMAHLQLSSVGFCRRVTPELKFDSYRGMGRTRHERVDVTMGPILNIQFHDYQVDKSLPSADDGRPEPTLMIFRNSDLIGGRPFQKITGRDLGPQSPWGVLLKRKVFFDFMGDRLVDSQIQDHERSIRLLSLIGSHLAGAYRRDQR